MALIMMGLMFTPLRGPWLITGMALAAAIAYPMTLGADRAFNRWVRLILAGVLLLMFALVPLTWLTAACILIGALGLAVPALMPQDRTLAQPPPQPADPPAWQPPPPLTPPTVAAPAAPPFAAPGTTPPPAPIPAPSPAPPPRLTPRPAVPATTAAATWTSRRTLPPPPRLDASPSTGTAEARGVTR